MPPKNELKNIFTGTRLQNTVEKTFNRRYGRALLLLSSQPVDINHPIGKVEN